MYTYEYVSLILNYVYITLYNAILCVKIQIGSQQHNS